MLDDYEEALVNLDQGDFIQAVIINRMQPGYWYFMPELTYTLSEGNKHTMSMRLVDRCIDHLVLEGQLKLNNSDYFYIRLSD